MGVLRTLWQTFKDARKLAREKAEINREFEANRYKYPKEQEAPWTAAYREYLQDIAWYGEHFRGRNGRVEPWQVLTLDKGHTWIHAPTGEQVTRFLPSV